MGVSHASAENISLLQADGGTLELPQPASRIITLAPHLAELVFAAGAGDRLIATVEYSDFPADAQKIERVGDAFRLDLEKIVTLRPDLIIAWGSGNPKAAVQRLEDLGLPVWTIEIRQPHEIVKALRAFGEATASPQIARRTADELDRRIEALEENYRNRADVKYFYQVAERPLYTVNGEHLISRMLKKCGGVNIFHNEPGLAQQVSHESVIVADPDVLIAPRVSAADEPLKQWQDWPSMRAIQRNALIHVSADGISRATPRMVDAVETACGELDKLRQVGQAEQ
jgi:iron complex transport system substrate-binding protein